MKPYYTANHRWAMAKGEEGLKLELARRKAHDRRARGYPGPAATDHLLAHTDAGGHRRRGGKEYHRATKSPRTPGR
jgi:hypothetical protein